MATIIGITGGIRASQTIPVVTTVATPLAVNTHYDLGVQTSLALTLPASGTVGDIIIVDFISGTTATSLSISSTAGMTECDLVPETSKIYRMLISWARLEASVYGWQILYTEFEEAD